MGKTGQRAWESLMLKPFEKESCSVRVSLKNWGATGSRPPPPPPQRFDEITAL
jgi:hypothetical protein